MTRALLRVPLLGKLLGANLALVLTLVVAHAVWPDASMVAQMSVVLLLSFAVTSALVWVALRPIAELERVANRVSAGDFRARVLVSRLADRNIARLSETLNRLLERVNADRARIQHLAGRSVRARDVERESVARELRDSLAQTSAGVGFQLTAARAACTEPAARATLETALDDVQQLTEDLRSVAETLYPGTLGEFGLVNAVGALARRVARRSGLVIEVDAGRIDSPLPAPVVSAFYRAVDEALGNVERHGQATHARVTLRTNEYVTLDVEDDGRGMDMALNDPMQAGLGLFSARAVLALVGGELQISSAPNKGTRVTARVPFGSAIQAA
ncbi:MAG: ATP-binding protein [Gemmatimonadaceae bacterium]